MYWKSVAAVSLIVIVAPAQATPGALNELLSEEARLAKAAEKLDPATGITSMMADDVRLYTRGGPFKGRAAALEALKANPANNAGDVDRLPDDRSSRRLCCRHHRGKHRACGHGNHGPLCNGCN